METNNPHRPLNQTFLIRCQKMKAILFFLAIAIPNNSIELHFTVEPRYNEVQRDWEMCSLWLKFVRLGIPVYRSIYFAITFGRQG